MRKKCEAKALVERNDYVTYTMDDVPPLPDYKVILPKGKINVLLEYKVILPKGKFNRLLAHYNIRTDPDLGIDYATLRRVACGPTKGNTLMFVLSSIIDKQKVCP